MENIIIANSELSFRVKNILTKINIVTLGDLIKVDYEDLRKIRGIGERNIGEIRNWLHLHGYTIKNDEFLLKDRKYGITCNDGKLLEEYGFTRDVYLILYRNNIFTLDDLLKYGTKVYSINGFGEARKINLEKKLLELGVTLENKINKKLIEIKEKLEHGEDIKSKRIIDLLKEIKLKDLDIHPTIRIQCFGNHIENLYSLLSLGEDGVRNFRNVGNTKFKELEEYLNHYGLSLKSNRNNIFLDNNKKQESKNIQVGNNLETSMYLSIENLGVSDKLVNVLRKNNIHTLNDIIKYGSGIYSLNDLYIDDVIELKNKLKSFKVSSVDSDEEVIYSVYTYIEILEEMRKQNQEIQIRLDKKEQLLQEYIKLEEERSALLLREAELDRKIGKKISEMKKEVKGNHYVKEKK